MTFKKSKKFMNILLISLGCDKKLVDSEFMLGYILEKGNNTNNYECLRTREYGEETRDVVQLRTYMKGITAKVYKQYGYVGGRDSGNTGGLRYGAWCVML